MKKIREIKMVRLFAAVLIMLISAFTMMSVSADTPEVTFDLYDEISGVKEATLIEAVYRNDRLSYVTTEQVEITGASYTVTDTRAGAKYFLWDMTGNKMIPLADEQYVTAEQYGILENVYTEDGTNYVQLITADGTRNSYALDNQSQDTFDNVTAYMIDYITYGGITGLTTDPVQYRVVNYTFNKKGNIAIRGQVDPWVHAESEMYRKATNRIGAIRLSDNSVILDLIDYVDKGGEPALIGKLIDESTYTAYGFNKTADSSYGFVLVTKGEDAINADSPIAVLISSDTVQEEGAYTIIVKLLVNGEEKYIIADPDNEDVKSALTDMNTGDVFLFATDNQNYINELQKVLTVDENHSAFRDRVFDTIGKGNNFNDIIEHKAVQGAPDADLLKNGSRIRGYFAFGPVMEKWGNSDILLATLNSDGKTNMARTKNYYIDSDAALYYYDYSVKGKPKNRIDTAQGTGIFFETYIDDIANPDNGDIVDWNATDDYGCATEIKDNANFALFKVVDGIVTEGYSILCP